MKRFTFPITKPNLNQSSYNQLGSQKTQTKKKSNK